MSFEQDHDATHVATQRGIPSQAKARWTSGGAATLREFLSMRAALDNAERMALRPEQPGYCEAVMARSLLQSAEQLGNGPPERRLGAIALLSQCTTLAARSLLLQRHLAAEENAQAQWHAVLAEPEVRVCLDAFSPAERQAFDRIALEGFKVDYADVADKNLDALRRTQFAVARVLVDRADLAARAPRETRVRRNVRWLGLAVISALALGVALNARFARLRRSNLARNGTVAMSSYANAGVVPATGLIDGDKTQAGCRTDWEANPWAQIDLGGKKKIHRVVITNRNDSATRLPLPLIIRLSVDGSKFEEFAQRNADFVTWNASGASTQARYINLSIQGNGVLELNEVEVY